MGGCGGDNGSCKLRLCHADRHYWSLYRDRSIGSCSSLEDIQDLCVILDHCCELVLCDENRGGRLSYWRAAFLAKYGVVVEHHVHGVDIITEYMFDMLL
jgi:hypothetical protein